ncbi:MAG: hypothetical protein E3J87_07160 [Candidatus Cloacimonadota bacterium]|nr:MAG: hypothetical protein E3J87_07160 [Candidatus Cloacimonadota bacterium]
MISSVQQRIGQKDVTLRKPYSYGPYNKFNDAEQWTRITEGCPHDCPYCHEPTEIKVFRIPDIVRNDVKIMDMNLLCKKEALEIIRELGSKRVGGKVVYYELICGIDYRFLTQEIADALKQNRFKRIRLAWDYFYKNQRKIKKAIDKLLKAGYKPNDLMVFMICNWRIPYQENLKKLDLCKVWNVKVCDCYFDGQVSPNIIPMFWTSKEIKDFRKKARKHNQLVNFKIDPEV